MIRIGAITDRVCVILSDAETLRVRRFVARLSGYRAAMKRLGVSAVTLESARDYGRLQPSTRDKLLEALNREEGLP